MTTTSRRDLLKLGAISFGAAAAACTQAKPLLPYEGSVTFAHGVASGDPGLDRVIVWTRVTPQADGPVPVRWVVAKDKELTQIVKLGDFTTNAERDYTVKVDVTGLKPGLVYYYGFQVGESRSVAGRAKTLPQGAVEAVNFVVCSCSNYPFGYFNGYEAIAARADALDAVLHLGDYIYEYGANGYGGEVAARLGRVVDPTTEIVSLEDYRKRHALYKSDADLQAAHAAAPWITVWDDHEITNNPWRDGAENHDPDQNEGDWETRKRVALQAYYEWMPVRDPAEGGAREAIYRSFQFGDVATLIMLETRLVGRDLQWDYLTDIPPRETVYDITNPAAPTIVTDLAAAQAAGAALARLPTPFDLRSGAPVPVLDYAQASAFAAAGGALPEGYRYLPDVARFESEKLNDPAREMLGAAQQSWVGQQLAASVAAGTTWQVLGNQIIMARVQAPDIAGQLTPEQFQALDQQWRGFRRFVELAQTNLPFNTDAWDGYPAARERLYDSIKATNAANVITVTGDTHTAWANELFMADGATRIGVEFGTTSITSPGFGNTLGPLGIQLGPLMEARNKEVVWHNPNDRGFLWLKLAKDRAEAEFHVVNNIETKSFDTKLDRAFVVTPSDGATVSALQAREA